MKVLYDVLERPSITEKSSSLQELHGKVVFRVNLNANKIEIKKAVEDLFQVKVASVHTTTMQGKKKRVGSKSIGSTSKWKKAYISLAEGKINFLDQL